MPDARPGASRCGSGVALIVILSGLAALAAGCGGGSKTPAVASLGPTTTATSQSGGGAKGSPTAGVDAFSTCMRTHGVPNFPSPNSQGSVSLGSNSGIDANSPQLRDAAKACAGLLPTPSPAQQQAIQTALLKFAACMRAHGVTDFPDPNFSSGRLSLKTGSLSSIDPNSPQFQSAETSCASGLPHKGTGSSGIAVKIGGHQSSVSVAIRG